MLQKSEKAQRARLTVQATRGNGGRSSAKVAGRLQGDFFETKDFIAMAALAKDIAAVAADSIGFS